MAIKFTNNGSATLASSITSAATSITLSAGNGSLFPSITGSDYFYATLINASNTIEIVKVTARSADVLTVVRGQDNTTASAYATGDRFELRPTAAGLTDISTGTNITALTGTALTNPVISGGTVNNAPIGGTTRAAGAFTTLAANAATTLADVTATGDVNFTGTGAMQIPAGTTAQRPTPTTGDMRFNTDITKAEIYTGSAWGAVGGGATGAGADAVFVEMSATITGSYTLTTGKNAMVVGPLVVPNGMSVTVPNGQRLVVL